MQDYCHHMIQKAEHYTNKQVDLYEGAAYWPHCVSYDVLVEILTNDQGSLSGEPTCFLLYKS